MYDVNPKACVYASTIKEALCGILNMRQIIEYYTFIKKFHTMKSKKTSLVNAEEAGIGKVSSKKFISFARKLSSKYRISNHTKFKLKDFDTDVDSGKGKDEKTSDQEILEMGVKVLSEMQDKLYAHDKWALLVIFQAMDAAGKDGAIKHM